MGSRGQKGCDDGKKGFQLLMEREGPAFRYKEHVACSMCKRRATCSSLQEVQVCYRRSDSLQEEF